MNIKFNKPRIYHTVLLQILLVAGFYSCSEKITTEETTVPNVEANQLKSVSIVPAIGTTSTVNNGPIASVTLLAGQFTNVGSIVLAETDTNADGINDAISATYTLTGGWLLKEVHLWIGSTLSAMPQTKTGNPQIGQFPYSPSNVSGLSSYTVTIPFNSIGYNSCQANYVVAAHASVYLGTRTETAWASGTAMNQNKGSWATYFNINIIDNNSPVVTGTLPEVSLEGCSVESAPAAVTSVAALEALGLAIADTRSTDANLVVASSDVASGSCPIVVTRSYTITDACGNVTTTSQRINIMDATAPVLSGQGANGTITAPALPEFTAPAATDNCDQNPVVTFADVTVSGTSSTTVTRTWTATDACGNSSASVSQTITIIPAPVVEPPVTPPTPPTPPITNEPTSYTFDTAFGGNASGAGNGWWYYYDGVGVETIWAGQYKNAGTVEKIGGNLVITLSNGFELVPEAAESVKIQGYSVLPSARPAAGQFTTYKGTSLTVPVGSFPYYVIHLDVRKAN